jgi:hypothetical protein
MKTNKDFRKFGDDSQGGEQVKGKIPLKEKKSKRSIYDEIDDDDVVYSNFRQKSVEDYFEDEDDDDDDYEYDDEEDDDDEEDFDDDEYEYEDEY